MHYTGTGTCSKTSVKNKVMFGGGGKGQGKGGGGWLMGRRGGGGCEGVSDLKAKDTK
jgi:hypothetical protein